MKGLFKSKPRTPAEIVRLTRDLLVQFDMGSIRESKRDEKKLSVIALTTSSVAGRRKLFAEINSFTALFIFTGQITLTGRILTVVGVTVAICSAPVVALLNMVAISVCPTWVIVAICEILRKVCVDVIIQRLGDATAVGMFHLLFGTFNGKTSTVCLLWISVALHLGQRREHLVEPQAHAATPDYS